MGLSVTSCVVELRSCSSAFLPFSASSAQRLLRSLLLASAALAAPPRRGFGIPALAPNKRSVNEARKFQRQSELRTSQRFA